MRTKTLVAINRAVRFEVERVVTARVDTLLVDMERLGLLVEDMEGRGGDFDAIKAEVERVVTERLDALEKENDRLTAACVRLEEQLAAQKAKEAVMTHYPTYPKGAFSTSEPEAAVISLLHDIRDLLLRAEERDAANVRSIEKAIRQAVPKGKR